MRATHVFKSATRVFRQNDRTDGCFTHDSRRSNDQTEVVSGDCW